ncbi:CRISPR-associated endoribonuclease Cas6 [Staphylococcus intermedius]|uniref:CRISPR-associated protein C n=1 Tax=Staphylococcus intermedius NCTC 11048 TaxID=1141106 RepID=A0A380G3C6_STAIN|nr:CRISPR-associated endoribonuclease Cas6 [Staphylococcus intermedius]PCF64181.1 CRISPR-associated endoribonuclease Cas6 [Staphylococcus intermedius]PCF78896.1 CRISPR-associated endoribonuclease Cas6 [Staphylococcus intermedius]PCF79868.1 CRISPR-associated endoribonuclease Cas6 [Staphylococcus intermedius]PCF89472.1 CRISPR-associated endoribonuclease Cas6 [Staphylococcus intermedius]SUM45505.1 CRISPR-associated protein C [Staphylococcus intermedius NCTC 11048]
MNKITVNLKIPSTMRASYMGSVLHGALMDQFSDDLATILHHESAYSPLKQRIYINDKQQLLWEIVSLSQQLTEELLMLFGQEKRLYLKRYKAFVDFMSFTVEKIDIKEMMNQYLNQQELSRFIKLQIQTPMSFKSNGTYMIFPDINSLFRSIMMQFDTFFDAYQMYDYDTLQYLNNHIHIVDYRLKTTRFHLEKVKIPSFIGEITLKVNGPLPVLQLSHFLLNFGAFSGVGIKTSLGMGKYSIVESRTEQNSRKNKQS